MSLYKALKIMCLLSCALKLPVLCKAVELPRPENKVIDQLDSKNLPSFFKDRGYLSILCTGRQISRWMVVGDNDGRSAIFDRVAVDFPGMHRSYVNQPNSDNPGRDYFMRAIKRNTNKMLLRAIGEIREQGIHILSLPNSNPPRMDPTPRKL